MLPRIVPMQNGSSTAMNAIRRSVRSPYSSRANVSRPVWSVPSRWCALGPSRLAPRFCLIGLYGVSSGAAIAAATMSASRITPDASAGWRYQRRARGWACSSACAARAGSGKEIALIRYLPLASLGSDRSPVEPDSRVECRVGQVGEQVDQHDEHSEDEGHPLHDREVALEDRVDHQLADAGDREDALDDHRSADQVADVDAEHGDRGDHRVAQHVPQEQA